MRLLLCAILVSSLAVLRADVTLVYQTKIESGLPGGMAAPLGKSTGPGATLTTTARYKNGKGHSSSGAIVSICDFPGQTFTIVDVPGKRYGTVKLDQSVELATSVFPQIPEKDRAMKVHVESKTSGRTIVIQGIQGEERVFEFTVDRPADQGVPQGPTVRMVLRFWMAKPSEIMRVPRCPRVGGLQSLRGRHHESRRGHAIHVSAVSRNE